MKLRYIAVVCFALIPVIWSLEKLGVLRLRAELFSEICDMLTTVKTRLQFDNPTTGELISSLCRDTNLKRLSFLAPCLDSLKTAGDPFNRTWERAVREDAAIQKHLSADDVNALVSFGNTFGTTDTAGQLLICENCISQFGERKSFAFSEKARLTKLYLTLGAAGAFTVLILFI